jgi:Do/DeqQ family serine protease
MKKIISTVLVASLGGVIALGVDHLTELSKNDPVSESQLHHSAANASRFVNYTGATSGTQGTDFTLAAEKSLNAVVHIKTTAEQTNNIVSPWDYIFGHANPQPYVLQGSGSGVIISEDGYIVTNNHVIKGADKIEVVLNDKRGYSAEVVGADPNTDIALLKIKGKSLPFILYGNSDAVKVGEWALAVGNPFNLYSTVTAGIISAKGRSINILEGNQDNKQFPIESFIQTDAAVNPGNSGGALVNTNGELIGINTAIASNTGAYQGYAFAVPVNIVKKVVSDLVEFGTVQRAYIGVGINDIDADFAQKKSIQRLSGAYINSLYSGGAAEAAGIRIGDIITKVGDNSVRSVSELQEQVSKYRPGDKVDVTVLRNDKEVVLPVTLKNIEGGTSILKKVEPVRASIGTLGATFEEVNSSDLSRLKITNGVKIAKLNSGKLSAAGIKEGFIITTIDKKKVSTLQDVKNILENKTGGVLIEGVYPNGMRAYYGFGL